MAKVEPIFIAKYDDQIVVVGDRVQDFRGAWWIFQSAEGPGRGWSALVSVSNPEKPEDPIRKFTTSVFPGMEVVPKPRMSIEEEIGLLMCATREFANE